MPSVTPVRRFPRLSTDTPLSRLIAEINAWMLEQDASLVGAARGAVALNGTAELTTNVTDAATVAGKPAIGVAASYAAQFFEAFDAVPASWLTLSGTVNQTLANTGQTGGKALRQTGTVSQAFPNALPYDASKLHRLRARAKNVSGGGTFTFGVQALDAAGAVLGSYAVAANAAAPGGSYTEYTGWLRGLGTPGAMPASDPATPSPLPTGTVTLRPYVVLNGGAPTGVMDLDYVSYERQDEDVTARAVNSLLPTEPTHPDYDPRYADGARTVNNAIDTGAIQIDVVLTARVESTDDPTIFLDFRTGLAPTDLVFSHPAFALYFDGTATFAGELSAATGTFAGALSAATGTFSGTLSAASGSFTGTVTAAGTIAASTFTALDAQFFGGVSVGNDPSNGSDASFSVRRWNGLGYTDIGVLAPTTSLSTARLFIGAANGIDLVPSSGDVSITGDLVVSGTVTSSGSGGAVTGTTGTFSGAVTAAGFTTTGSVAAGSASISGTCSMGALNLTAGATNITGSRTTDVASILNQIINALASRGITTNSTTP